jgi:hypothetical protein
LLANTVCQLASVLDVPTPSRASPLPHLICGCPGFFRHSKSPVGVSLLAIVVVQLASMLDVPPSSRAGSLPHLICGCPRFLWHCKSPVGAGSLAKAVCQSTSALTDTPYSSERRPEQARSHKGIVLIVGVVSNLGGDTSQFVSGHRSSGHFVVNFGLFKILYNNVQKDSVHGSSHS